MVLAWWSRMAVIMRSWSDLGLPLMAVLISFLHLRATALNAFSICGVMPPFCFLLPTAPAHGPAGTPASSNCILRVMARHSHHFDIPLTAAPALAG